MHPSLRAQYGLRTAEDVAIAERMIGAARQARWSEGQIDAVLSFYGRELVPAFEAGRLDADGAMQRLWDFAEHHGVGFDQRAALIEWHTATAEFMAMHDGELPPATSQTSREEIASERSEIERVLREDPHRYWSDQGMQNRYHDLIEQSQGTSGPPAIATGSHVARLAELEGMMGDHHSAYWSGPSAEALQCEYRNILSLGAPDNAGGASADAEGE